MTDVILDRSVKVRLLSGICTAPAPVLSATLVLGRDPGFE